MLNQVVLVGRLTGNPEIVETEDGKKISSITLAVPRAFKNADGEYETDFVRCTLWNSIATNTSEYCKKGDMVGIKGRIQTNSYEDKDGNKKFTLDVVAEKVTFLSSRIKDNEQENDEKNNTTETNNTKGKKAKEDKEER